MPCNLLLDFERNWNTGGGNSFNSFSGAGNANKNNNSSSFDRDNFGFNNFSSNSNNTGNSGNNNFGNDRFMGNNNGNSRGGGGGGCDGGQYAVHLRGMPYDCGESEVLQFFAPLKVVNCQVFYNNNGKLSTQV